MDEHERADAAAAEGSVALTSIPILAAAQEDNRRKHVEQWLTNEQCDQITDPADIAIAAAIDREATASLARRQRVDELSQLHRAALAWRAANPTAGKSGRNQR